MRTSPRRNKLLALARLMNRQNDPSVFVSDELIEVFDLVITDEEADLLLAMDTPSRTKDYIRDVSLLPDDAFDAVFDSALEKGLVWMRHDGAGNESYAVAPILVGWFEAFLFNGRRTDQQREFARRVDDLFRYWKRFNVFPIRSLRNLSQRFSSPHQRVLPAAGKPRARKIDINMSIDAPPTGVFQSSGVVDLIERYGAGQMIALAHCFCREWRHMVGEPCAMKLPSEACIAIGDFAAHVVRYSGGRVVPVEEATRLVMELSSKGAVHMVFHERENIRRPEIGICNCCRDCCGVLGSYNRGVTGLRFRAYLVATIGDASQCNACARCQRFCPTFAIRVGEGGVSLDTGKCIGCGQCALQCGRGVFTLVERERDAILPLLKPSEVNIP